MKAIGIFVWMAAVLGTATRVWGVNGTPSWFESEVGTALTSSYVTTPTLAFDHYGTPSVSWSSASQVGGPNSVRYSQLLGLGLWNTREMANGISIGLRTALTFDRAERPILAWSNSNGSVNASFNLAASQELTASGANSINPALSLSLDRAGSLRGMYSRSAAGNLYDIGYSGSSFTNSNMTTLPGVTNVFDVAMVADGRGLRQVAARAGLTVGGEGLIISSEPSAGGTWSSATLATADDITGVDIATDPTNGRMALVYTTYQNSGVSKLFYSEFNGFSMLTTELATSSSFRYEDVSLAFDFSDGQPAIAFERKNTGSGAEELMFAYRDGLSVWQMPPTPVDGTILMDAPGGKLRRPSLAFDDYGTSWPAIAYVDSDGSLNVAFDPPVPEPASLVCFCMCLFLAGGRRKKS